MTQQYTKLNTGAKEIQQVNPSGHNNSQINLSTSDYLVNVVNFVSKWFL